ncbi:hypothetical protein TI05_09110 [Achromatium sp. WMS3]|nr:hypothetical protein TI05_09110 [Achromatium sp. WMS3]
MTIKRFYYPIFGIIIFIGLFGWILPSKAARTWTEFFQQLGGSNHSTTNSSTTRGGIRKRPVQAPLQVPTLAEETQHFGKELKMAVVVGINAYPRFSGLRSLFYAKADAEALDKALKRAGYGVQLLTDKNATGGAILTAIDNIKQTLNPNEGTVIFAFAGHGFRDRSSGKNYLAPYEASVQRVRRTGLAVDEVETALVNTGARRRILFIDACRNDPLEGKRVVPGVAATFTQHSLFQGAEGTRILFSTKAGGYSNEYPDIGHGIFTHFLLKGLAGQAANSQGFITFRSLANYVQTKVPLKAIERGDAQRPYDAGEGSGWFLVARLIQKTPQVEERIQTVKPVFQNPRRESRLTSVESGLLRWIMVTNPVLSPKDLLEVKLNTQSSRIRAFGIFSKNRRGVQRVEARYNKAAGGIHIVYRIPANMPSGSYTAKVYVQEIGTGNEEIHEVKYEIRR